MHQHKGKSKNHYIFKTYSKWIYFWVLVRLEMEHFWLPTVCPVSHHSQSPSDSVMRLIRNGTRLSLSDPYPKITSSCYPEYFIKISWVFAIAKPKSWSPPADAPMSLMSLWKRINKITCHLEIYNSFCVPTYKGT